MVNIYSNDELLTRSSKYVNPLKGLMFSKKLRKGESVILDVSNYPSTVIHMAFVFQSLDVFCLDKDKKVIDIRESVKPFARIISPKKKAYYYIESSPGSFNLKIGDQIKFEEKKAI